MHKNKMLMRALFIIALLLLILPLLYFFLFQIRTTQLEMSMQDLLQNNPTITVQFISACVASIIGYQIFHLRKDLDQKNQNKSVLNLIILAIALSLIGYLPITLFILLTLIYVVSKGEISFKEIWQDVKNKKLHFLDVLSNIVLLLFSILVAFLLYRVN